MNLNENTYLLQTDFIDNHFDCIDLILYINNDDFYIAVTNDLFMDNQILSNTQKYNINKIKEKYNITEDVQGNCFYKKINKVQSIRTGIFSVIQFIIEINTMLIYSK